MSEYKHDHSEGALPGKDHRLEFVCWGCLKALVLRHDRLLGFVKEVSRENYFPHYTEGNALRNFNEEAQKLLEEIGKS